MGDMLNFLKMFPYGCDGDYTSKFYLCLCDVSLFFNHDAKVQRIFELSKFFTLKKVNEMLKNPLFMGVFRGLNVHPHFLPC